MSPTTDHSPAGNLSSHGLRPIRDQVIVRQDPPADRLKNGLYVPDSARRELYEDLGTVEGVGSNVLDVRVGDRVLFKRRPDSALIPDIREGGRDEWINLLVLREADIIGVIED